MDIQEKLKFIQYNQYTYKSKTFNASETNEFFDLDFLKLLYENSPKIINSQRDLLKFFDFSEILSNFGNEVNEQQSYLLKFLTQKKVNNIDSLLEKMPSQLELDFFHKLYKELHNKDNKPFWFSNIISSLKKQDRVEFFNNSADELSEDEIFYMIRNLYEKEDDTVLSQLMDDERVNDIAVKKINAPFFYEMVEELNLPSSILDKREIELQNILTNYQDYDIDDVKNTFCDLHLHDTLENSLLDIKTILDFAKDDTILQEKMGENYNYLCNMYNCLNSEDKSLLSSTKFENSNSPINHEVITGYYSMCQKRFKNLVSESINQDVTKNIKPRIMVSSSGKEVEIYDIENQTEMQRNVTMLVSTIPCSDSATKFKQTYYSDNNGEIKNNRRSCSLINETKLSSLFGGKGRITIGYQDLTNRIITSATLGDGGTDGNERRFRKPRRVRMSSYGPVDKFIAGTQGHTELTINMGKTNQVMQPAYILITNENPTQFEIDMAAEFQVPIRFANIEKYVQKPDSAYNLKDYNYYQFERNEILRLKADNGKSGYEDCINDRNIIASKVQNITQIVKNTVDKDLNNKDTEQRGCNDETYR